MKKVLYSLLVLLTCFLIISCEMFEVQTESCNHVFVTKTEGGKVNVNDGVVSFGQKCTVTKKCLLCGAEEVEDKAPSLTLDYSVPGCVSFIDDKDSELNIVIPQYVSYNGGEPVEITSVGGFSPSGGTYYTHIKSVLLNESITKIENKCFKSCYMIESICIPSNASVGNDAFKNCYVLRDLYFNDKVDLGDSCFANCYGLKNVNPNSVVQSNLECFDGCYIVTEGLSE